MQAIIIVLIICITVYALVHKLSERSTCRKTTVYEKGKGATRLLEIAGKYDVFAIYQNNDGTFEVEAYHYDTDGYGG